jgi:hypothetical protein
MPIPSTAGGPGARSEIAGRDNCPVDEIQFLREVANSLPPGALAAEARRRWLAAVAASAEPLVLRQPVAAGIIQCGPASNPQTLEHPGLRGLDQAMAILAGDARSPADLGVGGSTLRGSLERAARWLESVGQRDLAAQIRSPLLSVGDDRIRRSARSRTVLTR